MTDIVFIILALSLVNQNKHLVFITYGLLLNSCILDYKLAFVVIFAACDSNPDLFKTTDSSF